MSDRDPKIATDRERLERDAFELYRLAFTDALVEPTIHNFRAAVAAYDKLLRIIRGTYDGSHPEH